MGDEYIKIELCRQLFGAFSEYVFPSLELTKFHITYYRILHHFAHGYIKRLIITVPPQHGKSQGSTRLLPAYMLGLNPDLRIAIASFNTTFAQKFNRAVQRIISSKEYENVFPATRLNSKNIETVANSYLRNSTEFEIVGRKGSLLAVGRGGPLTGNQVDVMILDDLYKDAEEGNSPTIRESVWDWYTSAVETRLHNDSQELIVFTRWHEDDLIGRIEQSEEVRLIEAFEDIDPDYRGWYKLNFEAIKETDRTEIDPRDIGELLWPARHGEESILRKRKLDPHGFNCLYQGKPSSKEGNLYSGFKTYSELLDKDTIIKKGNYTDTADMGEDKLCSICYVIDKLGSIYITDVIYSSEPMEVTEKAVSQMINENETAYSNIESNNGGRGFARTIGSLCKKCRVSWFHQSLNKESRILTNAPRVTQHIYMPDNWYIRWPELYAHIVNYKRVFKANRFHDAPDVLTGIIEKEILGHSKVLFG